MRMRFNIGAALLVFCSAPVFAQKTPEKITLTPQTKEGALLIRVPVQPFPYTLQFSKDGRDGFLSRVYNMNVIPGPSGYRYIARTLKPGRYQLNSIWQQGAWGACLADGTITVDIKPGEIAWLGTFETDAILSSLQGSAVATDRTSVHPLSVNLFLKGQSVPILVDRDENGIEAARQFAQTSMSRSSAPLVLASVEATKFQTGGFNQAISICG